jgi:hypothetical protein
MCRIEHDNTGAAPGWFLDHVLVTNRRTNMPSYFACNQWLSKDEGDGRIVRDLLAKDAKMGSMTEYKVLVTTGDRRGAGTDANVSIMIYGEQGDSGELQLRGDGNLFEKGDTNEFKFELPSLGTLKRCRVWHDNAGLGPG